jgi:hypothetical protein
MGELEDTREDAFSPENSQKLQLVVQMRIYDVLMALLNESSPDVAEKLYHLHSDGKVLGSLPWLNMESEE